MGNSKRYVLFVLMCLLMPLLQTSLASAQPNIESNDLTIFQEDGLVFNETLYLNGSSNLPLADSKWFLIDLADEWLEVLDTGTLSNVMAVGEGKWDWSLEISVTMYNCTCGFLVSGEASNHTPHIGLIVYLGSTNHHPHILPFRTIEQGMDIPLYMLANEDLVLDVPLIIPSHISNDSFVHLEVCSAANLFCLDEMVVFDDYNSLQVERELSLIFERDNLNLSDGYWMFSITVVDALLHTSNTEYFMILVDQNIPNITLTCDIDKTLLSNSTDELLSSVISVEEFSSISFTASVDDGYSGRGNILTWTLILPDGSRRSLLAHEQVSNTLISLQPELPGIWSVELLVRDSAGWLAHSSIEFEVHNLAPVIQIELDSFVVTEGSTVMLIDGETWELNSSKSSDTGNDGPDLLYTWYVNGNTLVTGKTTLQSSDFTEPGMYNLRLVVEDNNGAKSEVSFEVLISEAATTETSNTHAMFIAASIILLVAVLGFYIRSSSRYANQTTVPKWIIRESSDNSHQTDESEL